jgi:hypothetical protein
MEHEFVSAAPDLHEELRRAQECVSRLGPRIDEVRRTARRARSERNAAALALLAVTVVLCWLLLAG